MNAMRPIDRERLIFLCEDHAEAQELLQLVLDSGRALVAHMEERAFDRAELAQIRRAAHQLDALSEVFERVKAPA